MKTYSLVASAGLLGYAAAHISMQQPVPFNPAPDTSPLAPGGSNFPCKKQGAFTVATPNKVSVGSSMPLSFKGTAVHNGGSCQVVLSKDGADALSASSKFKVIHSILGGCPGTSGSTVSYDIPMPEDVPAGDYTVGWTWYNQIGNREMYMNCGALTVEGGSGSDSSFDALPDMAVYNIASVNDCKTTEGTDVDFPEPGKYVTKGASFKAGPPVCGGAPVAGGSGGAGSGAPAGGDTGAGAGGNTGAGSGGNTGAGSGSGTDAGGFDDGQYHPPGGNGGGSPQVQAPAASSAPASSPTATSIIATSTVVGTAPTSTPAAPANPGAGLTPPPSNGASNGTTPAAPAAPPAAAPGGACTDGQMVCSSDGKQFGICNFGKVTMMPVADGTSCVNGEIQAAKRKRVKRSNLKGLREVVWNA